MKSKMKISAIIVFAGVTAALTLVIRIPIPGTGGYLNLGDMAVIFCGLFIGGFWGGLAGGLGSATADLIGGFFIFAPVTFVAKGLEGIISGTLGRKGFQWIPLGSLTMVASYFVAEVFLPGMGWSAAVSELPFNLIQAAVGTIGGWFVYKGVVQAFPKSK
jgi:uncharacterized membrane protein